MQDPHHYIHNDPHYCGNKFLLCIHKSWQQIRHGDAHDSRTQNSKAVQKHELVFTLRMSVYLHFCPLDASIWRLFFLSHAPHVNRLSPAILIHALRLFTRGRCYASPAFYASLSRRCSLWFVCFQTDMLWLVNPTLAALCPLHTSINSVRLLHIFMHFVSGLAVRWFN